jgi:hypothetical protein
VSKPHLIAKRPATSGEGEIGRCCWPGCGLSADRTFQGDIERILGIEEWPAETDVLYCPNHAPLVVRHAVAVIRSQREFFDSDRF